MQTSIIWLKYKLFLRGLKRSLAACITAISLLAAVAVILRENLLAFLSILRTGEPTFLVIFLHFILLFVFLFWISTSLVYGAKSAFISDITKFLIYPIPPWHIYLLNLVAGLLDLRMFIVTSIFFGMAFALRLMEELLLTLLWFVILIIFSLVTVALIQLMDCVLHLGLNRRRWLIVLGALGSIFLVLVVKGDSFDPVNILKYLLFLPSGLAADGLLSLHRGDYARFFSLSLSGLLAYLGAVGYLDYRLAVRVRTTGTQEGAEKRLNLLEVIEGLVAHIFPILPDETIAFVAKDMIYTIRNNRIRLSYAFVLLFTIYLISTLHSHSIGDPEFFILTLLIASTFMIPSAFAPNFFAFEGTGIKNYFIAPLKTVTIVQTKLIAPLLLGFPLFSAMFTAVCFFPSYSYNGGPFYGSVCFLYSFVY